VAERDDRDAAQKASITEQRVTLIMDIKKITIMMVDERAPPRSRI
jgi:hypothetical protein